jgi:hypothetical protein
VGVGTDQPYIINIYTNNKQETTFSRFIGAKKIHFTILGKDLSNINYIDGHPLALSIKIAF